MRPVVLDIDGFASFRERATIDFAEVEYFALVGPTGSGKSTVIDAMTFALYGTAPRWGRSNAIAQALAPTANRCTVRLVFDIGVHRYAVAREVRRSGKQIQQRNVALERLPDQHSVDAQGESLAGDLGSVNAAVEQLLGLSFDDFCKCIVLPQGQFQDFLKAKPADRQTILLKLLGADRYEEIRQKAAETEARAGERVTLLTDQLGRLGDATPEAETAAASRVEALEDLTARLGTALPTAQQALSTLAEATRQVTALTGDQGLLEVLRIPGDVADLQSVLSTSETAVRAAATGEETSRNELTTARAAVANGPSRAALERLRGQHQEAERLTERLPGLAALRTGAGIAAEEAGAASGQAEAAVTTERTRLEGARTSLAQLQTEIDAREGERHDLEQATPPADVGELSHRAASAAAAHHAARIRNEAATRAERDARGALSAVPDRSVLETTLEFIDELHLRRNEYGDTSARLSVFVETATAAAEAEERAKEIASERRQALDSLRDRRTAAVLRTHLAVGDSCPVCEQSVATLPPPAPDPSLDDATAAVTAADRELERARKLRGAADQERSERAAEVRSVARRIEELEAKHLPERTTVEDQLARIDLLQTGLTAAIASAEQARTSLDGAETVAVKADSGVHGARSRLAATHGSLTHRGAPPIDVGDLPAAWKILAGWATGRLQVVTVGLTELAGRLSTEQADLTVHEAALADSERTAHAARAAREAAVRALAGAEADERQVHTRLGELSTLLQAEPGLDRVHADLCECDRLEIGMRTAEQAHEKARAALTGAERDLASRRESLTEARRTLGRTRDTVVHLGAPEVDDGNLLSAWNALLGWAATRLAELKKSIADARGRAEAAAADSRERRNTLLDLVRQHDLVVPDNADLADLPALAAGELGSARAALKVIRERREQAADALSRRAAAEQEEQVAGLLAHLLRSTGFPRWLAGAALDTLVEDASRVLLDLSGGQFDLTHERGDFHVIDHADADSTRTVRTLSGGETFQASLALALALAQQMGTLGAGGAARLDSIFLDEGFGTLDPDTLEVVAGTLENLAHGERMVGVVTHVGALAERAPTRFVVSRDNRTSTVRREDA